VAHYLTNPAFWLELGEIILVNVLLSGDNAVMIALAARSLPERQQKQAIIWGSVAAIVILASLTTLAAELLEYPYLRLVGSVLLFWIAVRLLLPEDDDGEEHTQGDGSILAAARTILVANLVMSMDNVLGVAAVAHGRVVLLVLGLCISIPVIVFGSTLVLRLMERFPVIITAGAGLLGWVAGGMLVSDPAVTGFIAVKLGWTQVPLPWGLDFNLVQVAGAILVIAVGRWLSSRRGRLRRRDDFEDSKRDVEAPAEDHHEVQHHERRTLPGGRVKPGRT
jgi:YjbE family integral membrane protein